MAEIPTNVWLWLGGFVLATLGSAAIGGVVLSKLPADHFTADRANAKRDWRWLARNCLGFLLICGGIVLALPGIPGQGLLLVVAGLTLCDFPGKQHFERRLAARPAVLAALNRLRVSLHCPAFQAPARHLP